MITDASYSPHSDAGDMASRALSLVHFLSSYVRVADDVAAKASDEIVLHLADIPRDRCTVDDNPLMRLWLPDEPVFPPFPKHLEVWLDEADLHEPWLDAPKVKPNVTVRSLIASDDGKVSHEVRFLQDLPDVERELREYTQGYWQDWARKQRSYLAAITAFHTLFAMYQLQVQAGGTYEVVLCLADRARTLATIPVALDFDYKTRSLVVRALSRGSDSGGYIADDCRGYIACRRLSFSAWTSAWVMVEDKLKAGSLGESLGATGTGETALDALLERPQCRTSKHINITPPRIEPLYLPLPTDDGQTEAIRLACTRPLVIVNGPEFSGKTQLAANLLSHLLASGQTVLVTSHSPAALEALSTRMPAELRGLVQKEVGEESHVCSEESVADGCKGEDFETESVSTLLGKFSRIKDAEAKATNELIRLREVETIRYGSLPGGYSGTLGQIAARLREDEAEYGWLPFEPKLHEGPPLDGDGAMEFVSLLAEAGYADAGPYEAGYGLADELPDVLEFNTLVEAEKAYGEELTRFAISTGLPEFIYLRSGLAANEVSKEDLSSIVEGITTVMDQYLRLSTDACLWVRQAAEQILAGRRNKWTELMSATAKLLADIDRYPEAVLTHRVTGLDGKTLLDVRADAQALISYLEGGGNLGLGLKWLISKSIRDCLYLTNTVELDGKPCKDVAALRSLIDWLDVVMRLDRLWDYWSLYMVPTTDDLNGQLFGFKRSLESLARCIFLDEALKTIESELTRHGLPTGPWSMPGCPEAWKRAVNAAILAQKFDAMVQACTDASEDELARAIRNRDEELFNTAFSALLARKEMRTGRLRLQAVVNRLGSHGMALVKQYKGESTRSDWYARYSKFRASWDWSRVKGWLRSLTDPERLEQAGMNVENAQAEGMRLTSELCRAMALSRSSPTEATNAGVDQGKCHKPALICPLHRVACLVANGTFWPRFDVAIVDEAHLGGIEGLIALFLAKRVIFLGDTTLGNGKAWMAGEETPSLPEGLGDLLDSEAIGNRSLMSIVDSICGTDVNLRCVYDVSPALVNLVNVLRPEGGESDGVDSRSLLLPMTVPSFEVYEASLKEIHVSTTKSNSAPNESESVANEAEATAIIDDIEALCQTQELNFSVGVLSLSGREQAHLIRKRLVERLGAVCMHSRRIFCGLPSELAGDRRDAIYLSMVDKPLPGERLNALTSEESRNAVRTAISLARRKITLVHSASLDTLSRRCVRHQLLEHFIEPVESEHTPVVLTPQSQKQSSQAEEDCSRFAAEVRTQLEAKSFYVIPNLHIGGIRSDLAVIGKASTLAVECSDDVWEGPVKYRDRLFSQLDLSRIGVRYCRLGVSSYLLNPEVGLAPLWRSLARAAVSPVVPRPSGDAQDRGRAQIIKETSLNFHSSAIGQPVNTGLGEELIALFVNNGNQVLDRRKEGGCLWVMGDRSLEAAMEELRVAGIYFNYAPGGSRVTGYRPAWYAR